MAKDLEKPKFSLEQFRTDLIEARDSFSENYETARNATLPNKAQAKIETIAKYYTKIIDLCVEALLHAEDRNSVVALIETAFINHCYKKGPVRGFLMAAPDTQAKLWKKIAIKLAEKASASPETTGQTPSAEPAAVAAVSETQTGTKAAVGAVATVATVAAAAETAPAGRNFLDVRAKMTEPLWTQDLFDAIQVEDYVEMPLSRAYAWGFKEEKGKDPSEQVKVTVTKKTRLNFATLRIEVKMGGQKIEVDGSLFYNFGTPQRVH